MSGKNKSFLPATELLDDYHALCQEAGFLRLPRTVIDLHGNDRASFLNNFCTHDVVSLLPGQGCEAFLTSVQGKILGHILIFCRNECLRVVTVAGQADHILCHLDRYLIREDVQLVDQSADMSVWVVCGGKAPKILDSLHVPLPQEVWQHCASNLAGAEVTVCRSDMVREPCFLLVSESSAASEVTGKLEEAGGRACDCEAWQMLRLESGWPEYGTDITEDNLPQEVGRDAQAISFTKGCYLGQETVARIDALGHVNWYLAVVQFHSQSLDQLPSPGSELTVEGKVAGRLTSSVYSPRTDSVLALAYVRHEHRSPDSQLQSTSGTCGIISPLTT
ncbi:MAG: hypothetical protein MK179_05340 [Pirellulaceae bacterium]|nr:hypothetical protein [Pirellulaceae bacterium]